MESHARSIVKAATWRLAAFILTVVVAWVMTKRMDLAATIGLADTGIKIFAFYLHERAWLKVKFGRPKPPEYQI